MSKTTIYIDGYNLYYSRLQGTPYKWLDVVTLFRDQILAVQDPEAVVTAVKYFTAPVKANFARHGEASEHAQEQYHRALRAKYPSMVGVIRGFHIFRPTSLPSHVEGQPPSKADRARVWMIKEKLTDVNIALHVYRDAMRGDAQQLVICSNDSDLEPALQFVRQDAPEVKIGLVMPLREGAKGQGMISNKRLTAQASWVRHYVRDEELAQSQLPTHVQTKKKPASKPNHW
ncbi:hypothetical protein APR50_39400 [Variovorax paradoxus]|uniref:NYN domain-containing protein n=1 Tax=Variovorax paradoxus TaxID=34073 RepID=UPI0006E4D302|nr:hypothetical protein APR52_42555 [Variovorax paradoxus]KPU92781.1 hypothetical protein APR50_39400 [Variovorax paradoxus]KPU93934.1 hypothetical protein APR49_38760 [Variovorax paradoxus]KPV14584.1 hypothetical protein APR51_38360 [Variovorax paradoxus]KPV21167.1 hypothetical protein APR48_38170 [Variovorax paradoxus]